VNTKKETLSTNIEFDMWGLALFSFIKRLEEQDLARNQWMMKPTLSLKPTNIW
jgi:hypothetical protein